MGCNCGGQKTPKPTEPEPSKGETQEFTLELPSGGSNTYGSRLEAEAAKIRLGGTLVLP